MKLHFLKEDALAALKGNLDANLHHYKSADNGWIYDYFQGENPFGEFKLEVPDFQLNCDTNPDTISKVDMENAKALYTALIGLSDTQATDERLWAGLCHSDFWEYCSIRWDMKHAGALKKIDVANRYFIPGKAKLALLSNTLSKLWWVARISYSP